VAGFEEAVDVQAKTEIGRHAPGRGVGREQQSGVLEVGHHVANAGRRQVLVRAARDRARPDRLTRLDVSVDDLAEDLLGAFAQLDDHRSMWPHSLPGRGWQLLVGAELAGFI
jgi:hypothetical protein